ncbi:MAG: ATP-binding protein, partial [Campylobacterota bacterium]|nr:ATP-binding protein [Campylobacterota bacterium]
KNFIVEFKTVIDKTFSIVAGQSFIENLKFTYPSIKLKLVKSTEDGLTGVKNGEYYGHIDVLMSSAYWLKHLGDEELYISSQFNEQVEVRFATRKDDKILYNIFEKISKDIKPSELQKKLNEWVSIRYSQNVNFEYAKEILLLLIIIIGGFFYRQNLLAQKNKELEILQSELVTLNNALESKVQKVDNDLQIAQRMAKVGSWVLNISTNDLKWTSETYNIFELDEKIKYYNLYAEFINRVHPDDRSKLEVSYAKSLQDKRSYNLEHRLLMDDGSIKYVIEHCETIFAKDGTPITSYGTVQDITDRVLIKQELEKKDAYLLQQSRLAQMGEMLSMIAHQWRQPLASISTAQINMQLVLDLEKYDLNDKNEQKKFLDYFEDKLTKIGLYTKNLSQIITDFSDFYKPNKKSEILLFDEIVQKAYKMVADTIKSNSIKVNIDLNANYKIKVHENELIQVVLNLINNAREQLLQNNIKNPMIKIQSYISDDDVCLEVGDNAGGINEKIIDKLFDPYFSTKLEKNGTGLGLYLSKIIIKEYHHGSIYAKNSKNGAIFTIRIKTYRG